MSSNNQESKDYKRLLFCELNVNDEHKIYVEKKANGLNLTTYAQNCV